MTTWSNDRFDLLERCLDALSSQSTPAEEIIVAVDHNPALLERLEARGPGVVVVATENARGASSSRNTGMRHARGTYVAFLDDDACPDRDWIARMRDALEAPAVVAVGGSLHPVWPGGLRPWWLPTEFDWVVGCSYTGLPATPAPVRNVISANMAVRRDILQAVDGERAGFGRVGADPIACDETELFIRIGKRYPNASVIFDPRVRADHHVTPERASWGYFVRRCRAEGRGKARLARLAGTRAGLASERRYATRTLPKGVLTYLRDAATRRDPRAAARAAVIVVGLLVTTQGYALEAVPLLSRRATAASSRS